MTSDLLLESARAVTQSRELMLAVRFVDDDEEDGGDDDDDDDDDDD